MALSNWRDWANLADGPAGLLAERILTNDVADYIRFRAVCLPWRRCCTDPHGHYDHRFFPRQWTMLREKLAPSHRRRFLNVSTGECIKIDLLELCDHDTLALTPEGLLILLHERSHVRLLNPLTRHLTDLPPLTTLIPSRRLMYQCRVFHMYFDQHLRACGSGVANESTAVLCVCPNILGIAKPGDQRWTLVRYESSPLATLMFLGRFYCVIEGDLMVLETSVNQPPRMEVAAKLKLHIPFSPIHDSMHLVGYSGKLMLVHRNMTNPWCFDYDVYQLDLDTGKLFPAKSFNGRALFIGMYSSLLVSTEVFPSITGDAIYLSCGINERAVIHIEAYHLASGDTELTSSNLDSSMSSPHTIAECLALRHTRRNSGFLQW